MNQAIKPTDPHTELRRLADEWRDSGEVEFRYAANCLEPLLTPALEELDQYRSCGDFKYFDQRISALIKELEEKQDECDALYGEVARLEAEALQRAQDDAGASL